MFKSQRKKLRVDGRVGKVVRLLLAHTKVTKEFGNGGKEVS